LCADEEETTLLVLSLVVKEEEILWGGSKEVIFGLTGTGGGLCIGRLLPLDVMSWTPLDDERC
jgi:hypothetical protein